MVAGCLGLSKPSRAVSPLCLSWAQSHQSLLFPSELRKCQGRNSSSSNNPQLQASTHHSPGSPGPGEAGQVSRAPWGRGDGQSSWLVGWHSPGAGLPPGLGSLRGSQPSAKQVRAGLARAPWEEKGLHAAFEQGLAPFPCSDRAVLEAALLNGSAHT